MDRRIWFACWMLGLLLGTIAVILSIIAERWFIFVSLFFFVVHFIGLHKIKYDPWGIFNENPNIKSR